MHEQHDEDEASGRRAKQRFAESPSSLARKPIQFAIKQTLEGSAAPEYIRTPEGLTEEKKCEFLDSIQSDVESEIGLIHNVVQTELGQNVGIAVFDASTRVLEINSLHPFVAYFSDEFSDKSRNLPLELLATSEVLLEATMYEASIRQSRIRDVMDKRDKLLRELAKSTGNRNALMISQDLQNSALDQNLLQQEVVAAFDSLGFDSIPVNGRGKRDGLAEATIGGTRYRISIEIRAKLPPEKDVNATTIGVKRVAKRRDSAPTPCDHSVVVLADYPKSAEEEKRIVHLIEKDQADTDRSMTIFQIPDFARLIRWAPAKRISLPKLKNMFEVCRIPKEVKSWITEVENSQVSNAPYAEMLTAIAEEQAALSIEMVDYSALEANLRLRHGVVIAKQEIIDLCRALSRIVPEYVVANEDSVQILNRPDRILATFNATIKEYPESQKQRSKKTAKKKKKRKRN